MSDKCSLEYYSGVRIELFVQSNKEKYIGHLDEQDPLEQEPTPIREELVPDEEDEFEEDDWDEWEEIDLTPFEEDWFDEEDDWEDWWEEYGC